VQTAVYWTRVRFKSLVLGRPTNVHNSFQPFLGDPTKYAKSITLTVVGTKP
jgi:hypothetical protein